MHIQQQNLRHKQCPITVQWKCLYIVAGNMSERFGGVIMGSSHSIAKSELIYGEGSWLLVFKWKLYMGPTLWKRDLSLVKEQIYELVKLHQTRLRSDLETLNYTTKQICNFDYFDVTYINFSKNLCAYFYVIHRPWCQIIHLKV